MDVGVAQSWNHIIANNANEQITIPRGFTIPTIRVGFRLAIPIGNMRFLLEPVQRMMIQGHTGSFSSTWRQV